MGRPDDPYLRDARTDSQQSEPCPPGWTAERVGLWDGRQREVVYHPRRHDVLVIHGDCSPAVEASLPGSGWTEARHTDGAQMWVRDRLAITREALQRLEERPRVARTLGRSL